MTNISLSNDIQLIVESCKIEKNNILIEEKINQIEDWETFIETSYNHGVFPLVYHSLKHYQNMLTQNIFLKMKTLNMDIVKHNMLMTSELLKVSKLLEENGIESISFKGPTLSQLAYGDITLRQYVDLDLFIKKEQAYEIQDILFKNKYRRNLKLESSQEEIWFKYAHDISFVSPTNILMEFHWSMLDTDHPVALKNLDFFGNTKEIDINNKAIKIFSNEKFLVYLCIHGAKHLFQRVEWIVDIDKFIRTQDINWDEVYNIVKNDNSIKFFAWGLYLSKVLYDTPFDKKFEKYFDEDIIAVSKYIFTIWNNEKEFNAKNNIRYMLKLFTSLKDQIHYLHKVYLKPTFTEYWYMTFPKPLYFLYYPLRQYLLVKKYFFDKK